MQRPPFARNSSAQWAAWLERRLHRLDVVATSRPYPSRSTGPVQAVVVRLRALTSDNQLVVTFLSGAAAPYLRATDVAGIVRQPVMVTQLSVAVSEEVRALFRLAESATFRTLLGVHQYVQLNAPLVANVASRRGYRSLGRALQRLLDE
jgi:hypothetical protein